MFLEERSFWTLNIGHVLEIGGFFIAAAAYYRDRKNDQKDRESAREKLIESQVRMHTENKNKLEILSESHDDQKKINFKRDEQVSQLQQQTATLTQIASGLDRRLQMIEDRNSG